MKPAPPASLSVAAVQLSSQDNLDSNLAEVRVQVASARARGASLVVLPENFAVMGGGEDKKRALAETIGDGPISRTLSALAKEHQLTIIGGGMPERSDDADRPFNTLVAYGPSGDELARYRTVHLFDVDLADGTKLRESDATTAGDEPCVVDVAGVPVGLSICYDLRFPELYRRLVDKGARVIVVPAAFTLTTGKDHWHVLLRARAIENQVFVVAAAQWGKHPQGRATYGKSLVCDPWGDVLSQAPEGIGLAMATLDFARQDAVRAQLPCLGHRRLG
jgi:predicted amidohydrolase